MFLDGLKQAIRRREDTDEQKQIAAYNAGSVVMQNGRFINEDYVLKVTRSLKDIRSASSANS